MGNATYMGADQFGTQDIFRTISISFQPYIPFTQAYRMGLVGGQFMHATKRGTTGYFHWAPVAALQEEENDLLGSYPWTTRLKAYQAEGTGRLRGMNTFNRKEEALLKAANVIGEADETIMGKGLADVLDTMGPMDVNFTERSSRIMHEIELEMIVERLEAQAASQGIFFQDYSSLLPSGTRHPRIRDKAKYTVGGRFDVQLEHHKSFNEYLRDELNLGGHTDPKTVFSLEMSRAKAGSTSKKVLTQYPSEDEFGQKIDFTDVVSFKDHWSDHLEAVVGTLNNNIAVAWDQLDNQLKESRDVLNQLIGIQNANWADDPFATPGQLTKRGVTGTFDTRPTRSGWDKLSHSARGVFKERQGDLGRAATEEAAYNEWFGKQLKQWEMDRAVREMAAFGREMIDRLITDLKLGALNPSLTGPPKHLWTAPLGTLGDPYVGVTLFWPDVMDKNAPYKAILSEKTSGVYLKGKPVGGTSFTFKRGMNLTIPQIGWSRSHVWVIGGTPTGDILESYANWMRDKLVLSDAEVRRTLAAAKILAANDAVATMDRLNRMGDYQLTRTGMDVTAQLRLAINVDELMHLRTTTVAESLAAQLRDYYESGQMKSEVRAWYDQLMSESNRLTHKWYDSLPAGPPVKSGKPNTMGTTLGSEFVLGDQLGNPRKHYLGVWSGPLKKTWRGEAEGGKGDIGYNFSISPQIVSRRKGVASFK